VKPARLPWTRIFFVSGEGGATLPNKVICSIFFLENCETDKVSKDGMAMVRLGLGWRLGLNSSWVITAMLLEMMRYLM
jgi:hypothetical protein